MYRLILALSLGVSLVFGATLSTYAAQPTDSSGNKTVSKVQISSKVNKKQVSGKSVKKKSKKKKTSGRKAVKTQVNSGRLTLTADSAVLIDATSGQILYDKQARKTRPPASTTKIMTTILALEYGNLDSIVTVSEKAGKVGQATLHLEPGEKISLRNLIEGALIKSGNDACVAIAEHVAGDEQSFVQLMNAKAKTLGAYDTNFENTNGLPNSKHFSTAYDLALMARYGMKFPIFAEIIRKKEAEIESVEPKNTLQIRNTNKLLWMYEFADGVKTGTTNAAGKCLVSSATKNGRQLIAVVLNSPGRFQDSIKLLEYGFRNFQPIKLAESGDTAGKFPVYEADISEIPIVYGNSVEFLGLAGDQEKVERKILWLKPQVAPIEAGEQVGEAQFLLRGQLVAQAPLYAAKQAKPKSLFNRLFSYKK